MTTVKSVIQCLRDVESGGCSSREMVDITIEGEFWPAEPDVNSPAQITDLYACIENPWGRMVETYLDEDETDDATRELLAVADERGL